MRLIALALCLVGLPLAAWQQPADASEDNDHQQPYAGISVKPQVGGDVEISVFLNRADAKLDINGMVRTSMACDWQHSHGTTFYASGVCSHLLHTNHGMMEGRLAFAPLVNALFEAGIEKVDLTLTAKGQAVPSDGLTWQNDGKTARGTRFWHFRAVVGQATPPPFLVRMGTEWKPNRLAGPLLFVLGGPVLLAAWVRRQMIRKNSAPGAGTVWLNWLLLGSWLYWISAMRIEDIGGFAAALSLNNSLATLLVGAVVYGAPPLVATAGCLLALAPQAQPGSQASGQLGRVIRQTLASEATFIVPLGLFLVGSTFMEDEWRTGLLSMVAAYAAYRVLAWCTWRWASQRMVSLDGGELQERAIAIAVSAGVQLKSVYLLENRFPMEANAFAMSGGRISFTRGLLENMTRREVDSVIAHEVGHLRGKHIGMRTGLFLAYLIVIGPAVASLTTKMGLPEWVMTLPFLPLLYVLAAGQLSQRNELNADARAVQLTNDPEGTITALARLTRLTRSPVDWGGIQGSILSHPSMKRRVLAVAQRCGVPEPRALELLHDPDMLAGDHVSADCSRYRLPDHVEADPVFTATVKISHAYWTPWLFGTALIAFLIAAVWLATLVASQNPLWELLIFLVSLPLVAWGTLKVDDWWDCWFIRRMKRKIDRRAAPPAGGTFVALVPGDRVVHFEALCAWDLGWLSLDGDRLTYRGERAQFSVTRGDVSSIEIRKGPVGWCRTYAIVLRTPQSAFSFRLADRGRTRRLAVRLEKQLSTWWRGELALPPSGEAEVLPPPTLPDVQPAVPSRLRIAWVFGIRTVLMFLGTIFIFSSSTLFERSPMFAFVPFTAPLVYLVVVCPTIWRPQS